MQKNLKLGLLGSALSYSRSPQIHLAGLEYLGVEGSYEKFEIHEENFEKEITKLFSDVQGLNVTIPYKEKILKYLNRRDPLTEKIGAANTLVIHDGQIKGYNTDYYGFKESLNDYDLKNSTVSIIGAGGASRAIIIALDDIEVKEINIYTRTPTKVEDNLPYLTNANLNLGLYTHELDLSHSQLVINCTPVGQGRLASNMPLDEAQLDKLQASTIIYDLIYGETKLIKEAQSRKLNTIDGSKMLILQAVQSLAIWTGKAIDKGLIKAMTDGFYATSTLSTDLSCSSTGNFS